MSEPGKIFDGEKPRLTQRFDQPFWFVGGPGYVVVNVTSSEDVWLRLRDGAR
jgi:hypothetical protein